MDTLQNSEFAWWNVRVERLRSAISELRNKERLTIIQPFAPIDWDFPGMDVYFAGDDYLWKDPSARVDIYFNQGYDHNHDALWKVIKSQRALVTSCWFWDNHHLFSSTMHSAMLADVSFCAHSFNSAYIANELGHFGGFVPLCPITWSNSEVSRIMGEVRGLKRSNELYGGYNSYPGLDARNVFLNECKRAIPSNVIKIWEEGVNCKRDGPNWTEHPYYFLSTEERLKEWASYKVALCVSFGINTTIRMFESLLSGQIPIVVGEIHDLDRIISPADQAQLPVICVKNLDPREVRDAYEAALLRFDAEGEEGVRRRSDYILHNHMAKNRIMQMVDYIRNLDI